MKNKAQVSIGGMILIIIVIIVIVAMMWFLLLPPSCDESEQVELTGILLGFEKNGTFWDVKLDNTTYIFQHFDKNYMERFIGFHVKISCCSIGNHYNFVSAYISEEVD